MNKLNINTLKFVPAPDRCYGKDIPSPCFSPRADLHRKAATLATQVRLCF